MKYKAYRVIDDDETIERVEVHDVGFDLRASITTSGLNSHTTGEWLTPYDDEILLDAIIARIKLRALEREMLPPSLTRCLDDLQQDEAAKRFYVAHLGAVEHPKADSLHRPDRDFSHKTVDLVPRWAHDFKDVEDAEARDSPVGDPSGLPEGAEHLLLEDMPTFLDRVTWLDDAETQVRCVSANTFTAAVVDLGHTEPTTFLDVITGANLKLALPERSAVDFDANPTGETRHGVEEPRRKRESSPQSPVDPIESRSVSSRGEQVNDAAHSGADYSTPSVTIIDLRGTVRPIANVPTTQPERRVVEHVALVVCGVALIAIGAVAYIMSTRSSGEASFSSVVPIMISYDQNSTAT